MDINDFKMVIDALQPLVTDVTSSATWIAGLYIGFKLLIELFIPTMTIALVYKCSAMIKDWAITRKTQVIDQTTNVNLKDKLITTDHEVLELIEESFSLCHKFDRAFQSQYMHKEHAEFMRNAIKEKLEREK